MIKGYEITCVKRDQTHIIGVKAKQFGEKTPKYYSAGDVFRMQEQDKEVNFHVMSDPINSWKVNATQLPNGKYFV
ncbi:MAG: hypothetical protein KGL95_02185, partial [Patescibacteria group bacterium]|nr:hypothetical protein [Patescibacteria group bacterium]